MGRKGVGEIKRQNSATPYNSGNSVFKKTKKRMQLGENNI